MDLQSEKYGLSFEFKNYTTSGWALGDENVIGIRAFKIKLNKKKTLLREEFGKKNHPWMEVVVKKKKKKFPPEIVKGKKIAPIAVKEKKNSPLTQTSCSPPGNLMVRPLTVHEYLLWALRGS